MWDKSNSAKHTVTQVIYLWVNQLKVSDGAVQVMSNVNFSVRYIKNVLLQAKYFFSLSFSYLYGIVCVLG